MSTRGKVITTPRDESSEAYVMVKGDYHWNDLVSFARGAVLALGGKV